MHGVISKKIDPDLAALLNDGTFQGTLRGATFYRQHLDESFQPNKLHRHFARPKSAWGRGPRPFLAIRFPKDLGDALRSLPAGK